MIEKIEEIKNLQLEIDNRTELENEVVCLISQCRFAEADEILERI